MNAINKLVALCGYHIVPVPDAVMTCGYGAHDLLDKLDRKIGVDTRGGLHHDAFCRGWATPNNYVGTRIRLHEEYIRKDEFAVSDHYFWLGREG